MRRVPRGCPECLVDADTGLMALVGPWQYQSEANGWVVPLPWHPPGIPPSQYPTCRTPRGRRHGARYRQYGDHGHAHMTVLRRSKEILGVNNAHLGTGTSAWYWN